MAVGPRPLGRRSLSRDRIVEVAVRLADGHGLEAVTMRKVAATLDVGAMSLYRHTRDRDDLLMGMTEQVTAEFPLTADRAEGWRAVLADLAHSEWRCYRAHPWLREVRALQLPLDPTSREQFNRVMGALLDTGADPAECYAAVLAVGSVVFGAAALMIAPTATLGTEPHDIVRVNQANLASFGAVEDTALAQAFTALADIAPSDALERVLGRMLDGFAPAFDA